MNQHFTLVGLAHRRLNKEKILINQSAAERTGIDEPLAIENGHGGQVPRR